MYCISMPALVLLLGYSLVLFIGLVGLNMALRFSRNFYEAIHDQLSGISKELVYSRSVTDILPLMQLGTAGVKRKVEFINI